MTAATWPWFLPLVLMVGAAGAGVLARIERQESKR